MIFVARDAALNLINKNELTYYDFLFQSRFKNSEHLSTRQYALIVKKWVASIGLDPMEYGTHKCEELKWLVLSKDQKFESNSTTYGT